MSETKVLDKGFVRLVDQMGGDSAVVQSARVSFGKGTKTPLEDQKLINYLLKHEHGTPFEHATFKFHVKTPIFVMRQWIRHRCSSFNEISARYTELKDDFYEPTVWRAQAVKNKQGSVEANLNHTSLSAMLRSHASSAFELYQLMLEGGVAREQARIILPLNIYTEFYWTANARALMHFIKLRSESHAQWEIQEYSNALAASLVDVMPWTAKAFFSTLDLNSYPGLRPLEKRSLGDDDGQGLDQERVRRMG
jgi:thymidylate synthase (FAD)